MKKFLVTLFLVVSSIIPVFADTISYDKTKFAEISTMIDDAAYEKAVEKIIKDAM